jgi:hypothetical protein
VPAAPGSPATLSALPAVSGRRGIGGLVVAGVLGAVMLAGMWMGYARWQLLDWLQEPDS